MTEPEIEISYCDWCSNEFDPVAAEEMGIVCSDSLCCNCQDNATFCNDCNNVTHYDDISSNSSNESVCNRCISRYYNWCQGCEEYYHNNDACEQHYYGDDTTIHDYSYQPNPKWFVREIETNRIVVTNRQNLITETPFMGFELEIECPDGDRYQVAEKLMSQHKDWLYCKHDGSLEDGFEIVSHPHTLAAFNLRSWSWIQQLADDGANSWDSGTCGLHVHINKSAFKNNGHIWRFTNLVLYNRNQAARLAGRNSHQWASFHKEYKRVGKILKGDENPDRYTAVNLTNYRTIEVRMFRGSLHEPRVRAALEFVNANFEYTKDINSHDVLKNDAMSWWTFTKWVQENESTYPHLTKYLNKIKERSDRVSTML